MKALILAGAQEDSPLGKVHPNKALVEIHGKVMIEYIIDALKELDFIDTIAVVGSKQSLSIIKSQVDIIVEGGATITENILKGAEAFPDEALILIITSDIPMITPEAIRDFVERSPSKIAEFCYPVISKAENERKYQGVKRTYVNLKEGSFTGGNIVLVRAGTVKRCINKAEAFLAYRKKPWRLAQILGMRFLIKLLMGLLTIKELEKRVSDLFDIKARAVISHYPELGTDVDKESDLELVKRELRGRG